MQFSTAEEKAEEKPAEFNLNSSSTELSSDKPVGTDLEDNHYHTGFLRRVTVLLSRYGIETHG